MTDSDKITEQSYALARIARAIGIDTMAAPMHIVAAVERYEQSVADRIAQWLEHIAIPTSLSSMIYWSTAKEIREGRWRR